MDPDVLYTRREDPAAARAAVEAWKARLAATPRDFAVAWKLSKAYYWVGTHGDESGRRPALEAGVDAGRLASTLEPARPDGYFWMAANMGALAESFGMRQGLKYRKPIREALERAAAIDPSYLGGAPDRALGRWYFKVPGLFGGSNDKSVELLRKALTYAPRSTVTRFFLAETLADMGRTAEARAELQQVLDAPFDPDWTPEDKEWKAKATAMLARLR